MPEERPRDGSALRSSVATAIAIVAVAAFAIGLVLSSQRDWACNYRYWSDGGRNPNASVTFWMIWAGVGLGVVASLLALVSALRWRRPRDVLGVAIGLLPAIGLILFVLAAATGHRWDYNCSTD